MGDRGDIPCYAFLTGDDREAGECTAGEGWDGGLHSDFDGFKGAEGEVRDEFGGGAGGEVQRGFVLVCALFAGEVGVELLEEFVAAVFECSLGLSHLMNSGPCPTDAMYRLTE